MYIIKQQIYINNFAMSNIYFYPKVKFDEKSLILYGGSFSPIHSDHMLVINELVKTRPNCKFIIVPVNDTYVKKK